MPIVIKDKTYRTLFLDRDGVINERLPDRYVKYPNQFAFTPGFLDKIGNITSFFDQIIIITNQQGIGKGLMNHEHLSIVHQHMMNQVFDAGGRIDAIYYCPELAKNEPNCRKPSTNMPLKAQEDFPSIDFEQSIMVGDSPCDMEMGKKLNMLTVAVGKRTKGKVQVKQVSDWFDTLQ